MGKPYLAGSCGNDDTIESVMQAEHSNCGRLSDARTPGSFGEHSSRRECHRVEVLKVDVVFHRLVKHRETWVCSPGHYGAKGRTPERWRHIVESLLLRRIEAGSVRVIVIKS